MKTITLSDLEKIWQHLNTYRQIRTNHCLKVDENDGDRGACFAYSVDPITESMDKLSAFIAEINKGE